MTEKLWGTFDGKSITLPERSVNYNFLGKYGWFPSMTQIQTVCIAIPEGTGISETTVAEESESTYYRIDGTKVDSTNHAPGIYVRRNATETIKVVIR